MSMPAATPQPDWNADHPEGRPKPRNPQARAGAATVALAVLGSAFALELLLWARTMSGGVPALSDLGASDGAFLVVAILLAGVARTIASWTWGESYLATLAAIAPVVPLLGATIIVLLYLGAPEPRANPIYLGLASGLGVWIFVAPVMRWVAEADKAQPRSYGELVSRSQTIATKLAEIEKAPKPQETERQASDAAAVTQQAKTLIRYVLDEVGDPPKGVPAGAGFRYANAVGYMNLWRALHRAEELLIILQPRSESFAGALNDALRIGRMPNGASHVAKLRKALAVFGDEAAPAICDDTVKPEEGDEATKATALAVLAQVRRAFNIYQDETWEKLIRQRNRVLRTVLITSTVGLLLVIVAVLNGVSRESLIAAVAITLVGALVGLFARLGAEAKSGPAVDDYGLFEARLLATPLLSGLAALGGVFVATFAAPFVDPTTTGTTTVNLETVYALGDNPRALLTAAIFGLTPELLTGWLNNEANSIRTELSETREGPGGKPA